jgi:hypothetical protein
MVPFSCCWCSIPAAAAGAGVSASLDSPPLLSFQDRARQAGAVAGLAAASPGSETLHQCSCPPPPLRPHRGPTVRGRGYTSAVGPGPDPGISWERHGRTVVNSLAGGCAGEGGEKKGTWLGGGLLPNSDENGQGGLTVLGPT